MAKNTAGKSGTSKGNNPKKEKTEAKSKAPAGPPPNEVALSEDQQRALFFNHVKNYAAALAVKKKADADLKNVCKLAKAEGSTVEDIKTALKLEEEKGEQKVRDEIENRLRVARWMGASVGYQTEMFDTDRRPAEERAYEEGKIAGLRGLTRKPPHDPSVPQHQRWLEGWSDGQAALTRKLAPAPPPQAAAKPPAAGDAAKPKDNVVNIKAPAAPPTAPAEKA